MKRLVAAGVLVIGLSLLGAGLARAEELKPIPAAQAEKRTAEALDSLTDRLWIAIDTYYHQGKWQDCVRLTKEIVALDPTFVEAWTAGAYTLWNNGRDDEAIAMYEQGIQANPKSPDLYFEYAFYRRDRKQYGQAIELMRKAVANGATMVQQHMLPDLFEKTGRKTEALAEWQAVQKRFPKDHVAKMRIQALEKALKTQREQGT